MFIAPAGNLWIVPQRHEPCITFDNFKRLCIHVPILAEVFLAQSREHLHERLDHGLTTQEMRVIRFLGNTAESVPQWLRTPLQVGAALAGHTDRHIGSVIRQSLPGLVRSSTCKPAIDSPARDGGEGSGGGELDPFCHL